VIPIAAGSGRSPEKLQIPSTKTNVLAQTEAAGLDARWDQRKKYVSETFGIWSLEFFWSLELGAWSLGFQPLSTPLKTSRNPC
jgi:hypothetical protein